MENHSDHHDVKNKSIAVLTVVADPGAVSESLFPIIHRSLLRSLSSSSSSSFVIALSGGSLPSFLIDLPYYFEQVAKMDPHWERWHVILADERLVPYSHIDSNLKSIREKLLDQIPMIPQNQIHGINYSLLETLLRNLSQQNDTNMSIPSGQDFDTNDNSISIHDLASDYELRCLLPLWKQRTSESPSSDAVVLVDCALLGFGPDGHTCSLFEGHPLLQENTKWVAALNDSPKLPLERITLTLPVLNQMTRDVVFVGVGSSKSTVVKHIFQPIPMSTSISSLEPKDESWNEKTFRSRSLSSQSYEISLVDRETTIYPCAMVRPSRALGGCLYWIVDKAAVPWISPE